MTDTPIDDTRPARTWAPAEEGEHRHPTTEKAIAGLADDLDDFDDRITAISSAVANDRADNTLAHSRIGIAHNRLEADVADLEARITRLEGRPPEPTPPAPSPGPSPLPDPLPGGEFEWDMTKLRTPPTGPISKMLMPYTGNNALYSANVAKAVGQTALATHYMNAPSQGDIAIGTLRGYAAAIDSDGATRGQRWPLQGALITVQTYDDSNVLLDGNGRPQVDQKGFLIRRHGPKEERRRLESPETDARIDMGVRIDGKLTYPVRDIDIECQRLSYLEAGWEPNPRIAALQDAQGVAINRIARKVVPAGYSVYLEAPGQECTGEWEGHCPHESNGDVWVDMYQAGHDRIMAQIDPELRQHVYFAAHAMARRSTRGGDPREWYPGYDISPVTGEYYGNYHTGNCYFRSAEKHMYLNPAGPFGGVANRNNTIDPAYRAELHDLEINHPEFGIVTQNRWAAHCRRPFGHGENTISTGRPGYVGSPGDDPDFWLMHLEWFHNEVVMAEHGAYGYGLFNSDSDVVGSKFARDLPRCVAAMTDWLAVDGH